MSSIKLTKDEKFHHLDSCPPSFNDILPPLFPMRRHNDFNMHAGYDKIEEVSKHTLPRDTEHKDASYMPKRTVSLYTLKTNAPITKPTTIKRVSPQQPNQYNKWYMPYNKRFVDLRYESEEFKNQVLLKIKVENKQRQYNKVLMESKLLLAYLDDFRSNHKRHPSYIHKM